MSNQRFPYIPPDLLSELERRYPELSPLHGESMDTLMFRGGARSVIRLLKQKSEDQVRNQNTGAS